MKKLTIDNQEIINKLESLGFETSSRSELLAHMLRTGMLPSDASFKAYHKEYQEFFVQYEAAKAEFEREYVMPLLKDGQAVNWNLNYSTHELTIEGVD